MTLLESIVALVILGLTAAGFLGAFQGAARNAHDTETWVTAVTFAESAMEATKLGPPSPGPQNLPGGFRQDIMTTSWGGARSVQQVTVRITLPDGRVFELDRLAATP